MDVVSHCSLPVAGCVWKPRPDASILTFVCKATFVLAPGKLALADEQQPVHEIDCPWSDDVQSLYAASDLSPPKLRADIVLVGAAFAPGGKPVPKLTARLTLGEVSKAVDVWCDRTLRADGTVVEGAPFTHLPLLYERAAGGPGTDNPVGMSQEPDAYGATALPNLTKPGAHVALDALLSPTGFGPIGARWPGRLGKLGRYADELSRASWYEHPLPPDLDMEYFNVAPPDQQVALLCGGERLVLENLHRDHPRLAATLPTLHPRAQVSGPRGGHPHTPGPGGGPPGGEHRVQMRCDTLWIDTSQGLCTMTYRGQLLLGSPTEAGLVVVTLDDAGADPAKAVRAAPAGKARMSSLTVTERGPSPPPPRGPAATLPFMPTERRPARKREAQAAGGLPFLAPPPEPLVIPTAEPAPPSSSVMWSPMPAPLTAEAAPPVKPPPTIAPVTALVASSVAAGSAPAPAVGPAPSRELPDAIDLVHFDVENVPRLRRVPAWRRLLARLDDRPLDPDEDDPAVARDPMAVEDRREVLEILARGDVADAAAVDDAVGRAVREDGRFFAPIVLVAGELATPFGEVETLQGTVNTVTPLIGDDEALRASVEAAKELLGLPPLASAPGVAEGLTARVRDAFHAGKRSLPAGYLDAQTERALLEQRAYQRRTVLGGRRQRALFHFALGAPGAAPVVTYLPEEMAPRLPLFARFRVKMIVRVHHALDQHEPGALALQALALARLVTPRRPS
jgi:Uncharacterized protein conserved in bacteria (DUF2169)